MKITRIGLDLAKDVFQVHGVDRDGRTVVRRRLRRGEVLKFFAGVEQCVVGMEACGGAHHWGREIGKLGHPVRLMSAQFVKPYVKSNKSGANDAEANRCSSFRNRNLSAATMVRGRREIASSRPCTGRGDGAGLPSGMPNAGSFRRIRQRIWPGFRYRIVCKWSNHRWPLGQFAWKFNPCGFRADSHP